MRAELRRDVVVAAPPSVLWDYVTDWPRQGEWIPMTRVERIDVPAREVGARLRAWTGLGPVGFWDTMTVTTWTESDEGGRCEVLHTGRVVRGEGVFEVEPHERGSRFVWWERVDVPMGKLLWPLVEPVLGRMVQLSLRRLATKVEAGV